MWWSFLEHKDNGEVQLQSSGSQSSEVQQSEGGTLNSSKEISGGSPNISGVTSSMYSRGGLDSFSINHLGSAMHALADILDSGRVTLVQQEVIAAALTFDWQGNKWAWYNVVPNPILAVTR